MKQPIDKTLSNTINHDTEETKLSKKSKGKPFYRTFSQPFLGKKSKNYNQLNTVSSEKETADEKLNHSKSEKKSKNLFLDRFYTPKPEKYTPEQREIIRQHLSTLGL